MKRKKSDDMLKDIDHVERGCDLKSKQNQLQYLYKNMPTRFFNITRSHIVHDNFKNAILL